MEILRHKLLYKEGAHYLACGFKMFYPLPLVISHPTFIFPPCSNAGSVANKNLQHWSSLGL
jgi:hypothetical protein